jgi:hypothetical protein
LFGKFKKIFYKKKAKEEIAQKIVQLEFVVV